MAVRPTVSNVTVSLGLVSFAVDLLAATKSKQSKARTASKVMVCPLCEKDDKLVSLHQQFACDAHGAFAKGDAGTAIMVDGELLPAPPEEVAEATQTAGVRDLIGVTVHPASQVEAHTFASGNIYRLRPKENETNYALVRELVATLHEAAFLCEVTNKGATLLYRLVVRDGWLVLTELVRPDRIHELEELPELAFEPRLLETGRELATSMTEPFNPADYVDRRKARLEALAARLQDAEPETTNDSSVADTATDLLELLRRSVDAAAA